jgi:glyoxylase-like metal-dependent hydrolase (beta-lactamase superfamily II)
MKRIVAGVYTFSGLQVGRVYLTEDADGLTLIDTGLAGAADAILRQIAALGRGAHDVRRILITHAHPDHIGGLPRLKAATAAQVWVSAADRAVTEGVAPVPRPPLAALRGAARLMGRMMGPQTLRGTPVDRELRAGEILPEVLGGLQVIAAPGHSPGHLAFWQPERRLLFCGDVLMHVAGLRLPVAAFTVDMAEDRRSAARLAALDPAVVCFGHGPPLTRDAAATLRAFVAHAGAPAP